MYGSRIQSRGNPARAGTASKTTDGGRRLRRKAGGQDVDRLSRVIRQAGTPAGIQTKLTVGPAHDPLEREADRIADHVVGNSGGPAPEAAGFGSPPLQRTGPKEEEKKVHAKTEEPKALPEEEKNPVRRQTESDPAQEEEQQLRTKQANPSAPLEEEKMRAKSEPRTPMEKEEERASMQRKVGEQLPEEEKPLRRQVRQPEGTEPAGAAVEAEGDLEQMLASAEHGGFSLPPQVQTEMEGKMGRRLGSVRIHTDSAAAEVSRRINARAFTRGSHIFFDSGQYDPASVEGKRLLAHELAHVAQQRNTTGSLPVQREEKTDKTRYEVTKGEFKGTFFDLKTQPRELHISRVSLPTFKGRNEKKILPFKPFKVRSGERGETKQVEQWKAAVEKSAKARVQEKKKLAQNSGGVNEKGQYFFRGRENANLIVFGDESSLTDRFQLPFWDRHGKVRSFQVDHILEDQLGGKDIPDNYELLDASANMRAGSTLMWEIRRRIMGAIKALGEEDPAFKGILTTAALKEADKVRAEHQVVFKEIDFRGKSIPDAEFWSLKEVDELGRHVEKLRSVTGKEMKDLGGGKQFLLFTSESGGEMLPLPEKGGSLWIPRIVLKSCTINEKAAPGEVAAWLVVDAFSSRKKNFYPHIEGPPEAWYVIKIDGVYGGYLDQKRILASIKNSLRLPGLSPVTLDFLNLEGRRGFLGRGKVLPTVPFIKDADIELVIDGDDVQLRKIFSPGEISVPRPFMLKDTTLAVFFSSERGVGVEGRTGFEIERVGEGFVQAAVATKGGFELEGEFNFDSKLFDPARVQVAYREERFSVTGDIGIPPKKLRGVKSAKIHVGYADDRFSATGEAELDVPGVDRGTLSVEYSPQGWSIGGTFNLKNDIPGIKSGSLSATVSKVEGEEGYRVKARGTAVPSLPGIDSELTVDYDEGALTISAKASYKRGMLSGRIDVGATNRALDDKGQPTGAPSNKFLVYGGGELTMQLTPWLKGTVGVQVQPDGEMVVSGRLGLPSSLQVFGVIAMPETEIFGIGFDIPIFAIPVGPKSIGLKATIHGGLKAYAGIGPGRLEGLELGVVYNPAREEETHVTGRGRFVVPAEAGIKLAVRATIGLDVLVGGVEGGLEVAGGLGLQAEASAGISLDWSPASGLELRAELAASVQPKFIFTIDGVIKAWVAWWDKEWRWRLADYEYGSNLRLGVRLPIVYREGQPFQISYSDLKIERPEIEPRSLLKGLIRDIRDHRE